MPTYDTNRPLFTPPGNSRRWLPPMTLAVLGFAGVAAVVGLLLGLLIGWQVWPVQWTNAWPADLSDEARAHYLAAVAESYNYYGDSEAAEVARGRLFDLRDDLGTYIAQAQAFFIEQPQPNSNVHISNLGRLAQALDAQSPDIILDAPPAEAVIVPAPETAGVDDSVRAWVNWILALLAAVILVGGGFYVVGRLGRQRSGRTQDTLDDDGSFDDEVVGGPGFVPAGSPRTTPAARPVRGGPFSLSSTVTPAAQRTQPRRDDGDFANRYDEHVDDHFDAGFEHERDEDAAFTRSTTLQSLDYRREDEQFDTAPRSQLRDDPDAEAFYDEARFAPRRQDPGGRIITDERTVDLHAEESVADNDFRDEQFAEQMLEEDQFDEETDYVQAAPTSIPPAPLVAHNNRTAATLRVLGSYTLHYQAGIPDYEQAYSIVDPTSSLMVGEVGLGINSRNNAVQNNPDHVVALDLWLVDKKDTKSFKSQDRILLSEYADDHKLKSVLTRDRESEPAAIIPQNNLTFQLKGPNLVVDCHITAADYFKSGPAAGMFQNLRIEVTVQCPA
jgi:hypothetical protein